MKHKQHQLVNSVDEARKYKRQINALNYGKLFLHSPLAHDLDRFENVEVQAKQHGGQWIARFVSPGKTSIPEIVSKDIYKIAGYLG